MCIYCVEKSIAFISMFSELIKFDSNYFWYIFFQGKRGRDGIPGRRLGSKGEQVRLVISSFQILRCSIYLF